MDVAENIIILDNSTWRWKHKSVEGVTSDPRTSVEETTKSVSLEFVVLRPSFLRKNYVITALGSTITSTAMIIFFTLGKTLPAIIALPFVLGFLNMFISVRKDYRRTIS